MADLQRVARLLAWFCFGVLLAWVWMVPAYAETIPATASGGTTPASAVWQVGSLVVASQAAARTQACSPAPNGFNGEILNPRGSPASAGYRVFCYYGTTIIETGSYTVTYSCPAGQTLGYLTNASAGGSTCSGGPVTYSCPAGAGWTLSGTSCTRPDCLAGQVRDGAGVCVNDCTAGAASSASQYSGQFSGCGVGTATCTKPSVGTARPWPSTLCDGTCTITVGAGKATCSSSGTLAGGPISCVFSGTKTGAACSGDNGPPPTYDPCFGEGKVAGTISGVPVCTGEAPKSTESTKTTTTPTSTTETTTRTDCDSAGKCTTTTSSTYTSGGSGPSGTGAGSTTVPGTGPGTAGEGKPAETEKQEKSSFCEENPDSPLCKSTSFSGACTASAPACDGDAVQCAQAAEAWKINCAIRAEPSDAAYTLGKSIAAGGADPVKSPLDPSLLETVNVASIVSGAGAVRTLTGSCIPPQTFTVQGHAYTFDTTLFCQFATIVGYLMVAASSVIAIRMVVSGGSV